MRAHSQAHKSGIQKPTHTQHSTHTKTPKSLMSSLHFSYQAAARLEELVGFLEGLGAVFAVQGRLHVEGRVVRLQLHALV